ncbi:MAG: 3-oxoacid CoA-transferase subunit A [Rhodospirillaceae bacterium]|jgi:3-oxoadipate CoA-transferase alpha subunit|nr:3-oxoacid CoA-transferase subunit A [Rhodospirillaceae bacterium]MBT3809807.1 3-oxoacid CoA-transferase subunit A [Rhodospirillaceae bacterium]MBT4771564.1 3-oxoacid CoA-transferase subunit A [Rhodospirillaceae bacterium]MBT5356865.1 3-oxoacid CoA-transferase subunit A [Rhodospirillaceae bacterium]MBT5770723.1 3-oxoacid CoA-transferase subunit A [Rhodospirillaceae bacterium]
MKNKKAETLEDAVSRIHDGATLLIGGFGQPGVPEVLIDGVCDLKRRDLTIVTNNAGTGHSGIARLFEEGCVAKLVCTFPWAKESFVFKELYDAGKIELEIVPQGTLAERMRTAGAGLGGFLTPTGVGTDLAIGKETMTVEGKDYVLEKPLHGDFALIKAYKVDPRGNLIYRKTGRNFNPIMAMAAGHTIVEVQEDVEIDDLDPEVIVTPGVFVDTYYVTGWYEIGKERNAS